MFELNQFSCRGRFVVRLSKRLLVLVFLIIVWLKMGHISKWMSTNVCFTYPMSNVSNIVKDIQMNGHARIRPINDVYLQYDVLLDPSVSFCNSKLCPDIDMIFVVKSYALNFKKREAIRKTWGGYTHIKLKTVFVVGVLESVDAQLKEEFEEYHDILLFNIADTYQNLVFKTIFASLWLSKLHSTIQYVHFLDDDRMVNTLNVFFTAKDNILQTDEKMIGYRLLNSVPRRCPLSKHQVSRIDYPSTYFPPYLIGGTILTNMRVVNLVVQAVPYVKVMMIEDVYIGIVAKLMQIELHHHSGFYAFYESPSNLVSKLSSPGYESADDIIKAWHLMNKGSKYFIK